MFVSSAAYQLNGPATDSCKANAWAMSRICSVEISTAGAARSGFLFSAIWWLRPPIQKPSPASTPPSKAAVARPSDHRNPWCATETAGEAGGGAARTTGGCWFRQGRSDSRSCSMPLRLSRRSESPSTPRSNSLSWSLGSSPSANCENRMSSFSLVMTVPCSLFKRSLGLIVHLLREDFLCPVYA